MAHGTVNVRLRPVKLAFLVNPKDKDSLLKAIEINTFLWGGMYNPIIPTYEQLPENWEDLPSKDLTPQSVVLGYLDNFDPDYVIPMGKCADYSPDVSNRRKIDDVAEILEPVEEDGTPKYGIGLFEVLNHFIHRELKFQRRDPLDICVPFFGSKHRTFLASVFGIISENINTIFWERYAAALDAKKTDCSGSNYVEILNARKLFLQCITHYNLRPIRGPWSWEQCIFLLDATNSLDIMDYWNLRAIGWDIIPIPKQFAQNDNTKQCALDFIEANHVPHDLNPEIYHHTAILKSRSISEDEHKNFIDALDVPKPDEPSKMSKVVMYPSYPRMWNEGVRRYDHVECCHLEAGAVEYDISPDQDTIRFKTLDPECIGRFTGYSEARFANEIDLRLYDDKEILAEVIPEGGRELTRVIGGFGLLDWRLSRNGLVYLSRRKESRVSLSLPSAEAIVVKWLETQGWAIELSSAGRVAKQMIRQLGGKSGAGLLAQEGLIRLFRKMNSGGVDLSELLERISSLQKLLECADFQTVASEAEAFVNSLEEIQLLHESNDTNAIADMLPDRISILLELLKRDAFQTANDEVKEFAKYLRDIESELGGDGKSMLEKSVRDEIYKIANQARYYVDAETILQRLIEANVLQLGLDIQCPECTKHSWYSMKRADYQLQCTDCLAEFSFPPTPKDVKWSYRTLGPFRLPKQADGAYTVLLTLRFFSDFSLLSGATTPLMSFKAKRNEIELEADLALFFQASKFGASETERIFVECKSFNSFNQNDADKMEKLGNAFPGAVLVFASLKDVLSDEEKTILRSLVNRCREYWKNDRPVNPVMILTGTELFAELDLSRAWEDAGGPRAAYAKRIIPRDLPELCDITQRVYLDMKPWHQWLDEKSGRITSVHPTTWTRPNGEMVRSDN